MFRFMFGVVFSLFWTSAFISGKYLVAYLTPLDLLSLRFLLATVMMTPIALFITRGDLSVYRNKQLWVHGAILGVLNYVLYLGLSYMGLQTVSPELVVLIVSMMPFVTNFVVSLITNRWSMVQWLAIGLGFTGVYLVLSAKMPKVSLTVGIVWTCLGMLALAAATLFYQYKASHHKALPLTLIQNLVAGVVLLPLANPSGWYDVMQEPVFALSMWHQVILVSVVAMLMWFYLLRWFGSAKASAFHLLNPIFGAVLAWWFFHAPLGMLDMTGTLMVVIALAILHRHKQQSTNTSA